jgi:acyl-CoA thioesterase-2
MATHGTTDVDGPASEGPGGFDGSFDTETFPPGPGSDGDLLQVLELEQLEVDLYRAPFVFDDPFPLYGGQVAAQALRAAGLTAGTDRVPHSLHGYFLRPGSAAHPVVFRVFRDRDGRSYSSRRVVALQHGEVVFNLAASFHVVDDGPDLQIEPGPQVPGPGELGPGDYVLPRLFSMEARVPRQSYPDLAYPLRCWVRTTVPLGDDPLLQACAVTYLSDIGSGMEAVDTSDVAWLSSLDHSMWFHRPVRLDEWVLMDLDPVTAAGGRGFYNGRLYDVHGRLCVTIAQESLFRYDRTKKRP